MATTRPPASWVPSFGPASPSSKPWVPATKKDPNRAIQIKAKKDAITRKLQLNNRAAQVAAGKKINPKKGGVASYVTEKIAGREKGFGESDFGVGAGAAIPYQITKTTNTVKKAAPGKKVLVASTGKLKPRPMPKK